MEKLQLLFITVLGPLFGILLILVGSDLLKLKSFKQDLEEFEKSPSKQNLIRKYWYGWAFSVQRARHKFWLEIFGDRLLTFFFKYFVGICFVVFGALLIAFVVNQLFNL